LAVLLPNAGRAEVDPAKLRDYLLSRTHPVGRFKARFFTALGFSAEQWRQLETALRTDHLSQPAEPVGTNERGQKYAIRAILKGTAGEAMVVSVWFLPHGSDVPRFVTAYPWSER
jgi:hypothetical protein